MCHWTFILLFSDLGKLQTFYSALSSPQRDVDTQKTSKSPYNCNVCGGGGTADMLTDVHRQADKHKQMKTNSSPLWCHRPVGRLGWGSCRNVKLSIDQWRRDGAVREH